MTSSSPAPAAHHSIADVERDTGLSKDTLRVWERRYGFPTPARDALGERQYDDAQLHRLRNIRRLLDAGHRPGQVVPLTPNDLSASDTHQADQRIQARANPRAPVALSTETVALTPWMRECMHMLRTQDAPGLRNAFARALATLGLARFITECVVPMNEHVGQAWLDGDLAVYEEHLYTECVQGVLRQAMESLRSTTQASAPRVLLTTLPGEPHGLGLLMAECFMVLEGCQTVPLGTQTPLADIVLAARTSGADIVALGFTAIQNTRDVRSALAQLRQRLPPQVAIWAGGRCPALKPPRRPRAAAGVPPYWPMVHLEDIPGAVARWRAG